MTPRTLLLPIFLFIFITNTFAQAAEIFAKAEKIEITSFFDVEETELATDEYRVLLHMDYGASVIKNWAGILSLYSGTVRKVNLYYSDFPKGANLDQLNIARIHDLYSSYESVVDPDIEWKVIKQTKCSSKSEALTLFHGFEVILQFSEAFDLTDVDLDTTFNDFVVERVLARNDWNEMLIVTDMTGSMSPYIAQLFLWLKLNTIDDRIKQFVFFNDGDGYPDDTKVIGETGGIYQTKSKEYDEVEDVGIQCMLSGNGGDGPENDMEALLKGLRLCPDCKENIMIVDNNSAVRDIELLVDVDQPVRVIICGSKGDVNEDYLNIARLTGGSVHLIEQDLFDLMKLNEGEEIEIGKSVYRILEDRFVRVEKT